jgi:hypothetical protein
MNKKMISTVLFVLVGALMVSAFSWVAITGFNKSQRAGMGNLTSLNAAEVSAYRWDALAKYYASHPTLTSDLTLLNAEEISAYRWNALAMFYEKQVSQSAVAQDAIIYGPPGR